MLFQWLKCFPSLREGKKICLDPQPFVFAPDTFPVHYGSKLDLALQWKLTFYKFVLIGERRLPYHRGNRSNE